jgi:hypothetical protein
VAARGPFLPWLIGIATQNAHALTIANERHVLYVQCDEFGSAQRAGKTK